MLADSAVTLARGDSNIVLKDIINRMIKALLHTRDHPTKCLEHHFLWVELAVLSQFLLNLSFNSSIIGNNVLAIINSYYYTTLCLSFLVLNKLPDLFYICAMMMGHGPIRIRAAIHGILMNTINSLFAVPKISENGIYTSICSLILVLELENY